MSIMEENNTKLGLKLEDYALEEVPCIKNARKLTQCAYNLKLETLRLSREIAVVENTIATLKSTVAFDVATEQNEEGKPKYKNEMTRKAEIEIRLKPLVEKSVNEMDKLSILYDQANAFLGYAHNLLKSEIAFAPKE